MRRPSPALLLLLLGLVAGGALRLYLALTEDGLYWPDEVHQSLEPAHRLVWGYGLVAWEFARGARSWALPGLVAGLFELARALHLPEPGGYLRLTRCAFALAGTGCIAGAYALARRLGAGALAAASAALLLALGAVPLYFSHRAMSENAAALPLVAGLALALPEGATRRQTLGGAALLALATLLRLQCGLLCLGLLAVLLVRRRWARAAEAAAVLAVGALLYGLLDRLTWGSWFQSARVYLDFNLAGGAARWGTSPFGYYLRVLLQAMPAVTLAGLGLALLAARRAPALWLLSAAFFLVHALQPHKELRFLLPLFPLVAALAGVGLEALLSQVQDPAAARAAAGALLAVGVLSAASAPQLRFGDLGAYEESRPRASAWDDAGPINRLLERAGHAPDLCGLKVEVAHLAWTGGYSYLHRPVPLYPHDGPPRGAGLYNYAITVPGAVGSDGGAQVLASDGPLVLVRLQRAGCVADAHFSWRLD
ncbi:hypothetical protein FGE12_06185 [Aggregicoccus sp. 17bor-14]|uniref:hypothetical protein n=1 Tax=Myxococcaceae TaxID=31 RepID=UPI00129C32EC|nr:MULTISPECIES: hypothetical protein [Myxococcaceae]MBF5041974.1 hypothetical protein [Simulacricoccus sp. 17bor-14]MRI87755.1 hypothetical protein [Aggregicoccus sp. 17bor-14]